MSHVYQFGEHSALDITDMYLTINLISLYFKDISAFIFLIYLFGGLSYFGQSTHEHFHFWHIFYPVEDTKFLRLDYTNTTSSRSRPIPAQKLRWNSVSGPYFPTECLKWICIISIVLVRKRYTKMIGHMHKVISIITSLLS